MTLAPLSLDFIDASAREKMHQNRERVAEIFQATIMHVPGKIAGYAMGPSLAYTSESTVNAPDPQECRRQTRLEALAVDTFLALSCGLRRDPSQRPRLSARGPKATVTTDIAATSM